MADFEFEYNQSDRDLVVNQSVGTFSQMDYIRLTIYPTEAINNVVTLQDGSQAIFYSSLNPSPFNINTSPFGGGAGILNTYTIGGTGEENDFKIYENGNDIYIKPNEIFNEFELPQGNYKLQIDFLNQLSPNSGVYSNTNEQNEGPDVEIQTQDNIPNVHYQFIIKQISTSRKEVRLKLLDRVITPATTINNVEIIEQIKIQLNNSTNKYAFKHILNIGTGNHIPIMNYQFDTVTDGQDNQSIILKLYEPLKTNIKTLSMVTIEREVLITQIQEMFYFSDVPDVFFGDGLIPDEQENWINPDGNDIGFQNLNDLAYSSSLNDIEIDSLISSSQYGYPNLNTNFNEFKNHTFFGSAKKKLENFKIKVETIQGHYSDISQSLHSIGVDVAGDSTFVVQKRKDLFNKISNEFKNFSPYERFLYYDGQGESTSSAPGIGKNYAHSVPVSRDNNYQELINTDGFKVVYNNSSTGGDITNVNLFNNQYKAQSKPLFNYSGSVYLSFLLKGTNNLQLNREIDNHLEDGFAKNGFLLPHDTMFTSSLLQPTITSSEYRRFIFEASSSYFIPNTNNNDVAEITEAGFGFNSTQFTILTGSLKTGSYQIKDSTNKYPTTVISQSGVPFKGSVMPAGDLFKIFYKNELSESLIGYYDYQGVTIDDNDFEVFDKSGNNNTVEFVGSGQSFTSASITTGIRGGDAFAITFSGSLAGLSGSLFLTTQNSTAPIESAPISMSRAADEVHGFTMATFYKSTSTKTNATILAMDIKSGSTDVHGWHLTRTSDKISGEITREGVDILDQDTSEDGLTTGTLTPRDGDFHHIALTYDNLTGTGSVYFDGVLQKQGNSRGFITGSNQIYRLIVGSGPGSAHGYADAAFDETRFYTRALSANEIKLLHLNPNAKTETKVTDVKLSLNNPANILPFDTVYKTTSTNFTNWYNDLLTKAETFDTDNIHSFENNLPLYIQDSSDYQDMKDFLNLQGEQYDLIKNHIDSMGTIHKRGYKKNDSPPENSFPILLSNVGWEAINPFTGSLTETLGGYLSGITTIDDIKNNTWRKTLNNLIHIYKSKGTKNSVRTLLNTYGYPPDILQFQEFGGSTEESNPRIFTNTSPSNTGVDLSLTNKTGSFSFISKKQKLYNYRINGNAARVIDAQHYRDGADINTIEFLYKHVKSTNEQKLLEKASHAVSNLTNFDLRLVPSADGISSSFAFRLNNSVNGTAAIATNAVSMSTSYLKVKDGELWNVMLQRMTSSLSGSGTNEYRLHASLQDGTSIKTYSYVTMSIQGQSTNTYITHSNAMTASVTGRNYFANQNWVLTGSFSSVAANGNISYGGRAIPNNADNREITGSIAEIRGWSTALSTSKFRQHTLNKFSTVGNTINSYKDELVYHYKLNENYSFGSASVSASGQNLNIVDSAPETTFKNYTRTKEGKVFSGSFIYGFDIVDDVKLTLQDNIQKSNDNGVLVSVEKIAVGDLNSSRAAVKSLIDSDVKKPRLKTSNKLEIYRSPQTFVDNYILDNISGFSLETLYGNPLSYYSQSYTELETFRINFFDAHSIEVDTNKFIRAHENMFNQSIIEGMKKIIPARTTFSDKNSNFGVEIKPTILEKQKFENEYHSVEANPNTGIGTVDVNDVVKISDKLGDKQLLTIYDSIKEGTAQGAPSSSGALELPISKSISAAPSTSGSALELPKTGSLNAQPTYGGSTVVLSKDGTIDYALDANKSYSDVHKNWGTTQNDVQFIHYNINGKFGLKGGTGSRGDYNVGHIDTRFHFYSIGDSEYYSASMGNASNFDDDSRFYNRLMIDDDFHSDITYESYIYGNPGPQTGRMMGKTRFFSASADGGTLTLPRNHVTKFSNPFKEQMFNGAQNKNPGFLNVRYEDYSTSSFYRVKVTGGGNQIRVQSGNPGIGSDDNIIYDDNSGGGGAL